MNKLEPGSIYILEHQRVFTQKLSCHSFYDTRTMLCCLEGEVTKTFYPN